MKNTIVMIVVAVVALALGFYGGIKYGQSPSALAKLSSSQRQALLSAIRPGNTNGGGFAGRGGRLSGTRGGGAIGEVISKDANSITVKMPDNSTKIIFYSTSTTIVKAVAGTVNDLTVGEQVMVNGTANNDGSITAQNIQIRPANTNSQ